jgi:hypothetical protein
MFHSYFWWQQEGVVSECNFTYKIKQKMNFSWCRVCISKHDFLDQLLKSRERVQGSIKLPQKGKQFASLNYNKRERGFLHELQLF